MCRFTTSLLSAVSRNELREIQYLLELGADPNAIGLLQAAIEKNRFAIVHELLRQGAHVNMYHIMVALNVGSHDIADLLKKFQRARFAVGSGGSLKKICFLNIVQSFFNNHRQFTYRGKTVDLRTNSDPEGSPVLPDTISNELQRVLFPLNPFTLT